MTRLWRQIPRRGIVDVHEHYYGWHHALAGWQQIPDCVTGVACIWPEPVVPPLPNSDYQTSLTSLAGILTAVNKRATHRGSYRVDISLKQ